MEGREVGEVVVRHGGLPAPLGPVAGVLGEVVGLRRERLGDEVHAFGGGRVADFARDAFKPFQRVREDGHAHVVFAERKALRFQDRPARLRVRRQETAHRRRRRAADVARA